MVQQFVHGMEHIDELVMIRMKDKGDCYDRQAERDEGGSVKERNVVALTELGGNVVERSVCTPYGELKMHQETGYGDYDGDGDVDGTDKGTPGTTCTGGTDARCFGR
jgi:hypothetical protein